MVFEQAVGARDLFYLDGVDSLSVLEYLFNLKLLFLLLGTDLPDSF